MTDINYANYNSRARMLFRELLIVNVDYSSNAENRE